MHVLGVIAAPIGAPAGLVTHANETGRTGGTQATSLLRRFSLLRASLQPGAAISGIVSPVSSHAEEDELT